MGRRKTAEKIPIKNAHEKQNLQASGV